MSFRDSEFSLAPRMASRLAREVQDLLKKPEPGVRIVVDEATGLPVNLQELTVEMEGPKETPYEDKFFLLRFTFGSDFPNTPPTAHFLTKVYHPNVDFSHGAVCVNTLKRDWKADHTLRHCLAVIRCLLLQPFPDSALNEDAGKLFMESYDEYCKRARLHADVHGKRLSITHKEDALDSRVLQTSSQRNSSAPATTTIGKKKLNKSKLTKKKSLKRL